MDSDDQITTKSVASAIQARIRALRRAFQRELGRKPTLLQAGLMDRAAITTARAEAAAIDPDVSLNDFIRLDHAAARARAEMFTAIAKREPAGETLGDIMREGMP